MANKHLSRKPHKLRNEPHVWWYEADRGIEVVVRREAITDTGAIVIDIPWNALREALKRKDKK